MVAGCLWALENMLKYLNLNNFSKKLKIGAYPQVPNRTLSNGIL